MYEAFCNFIFGKQTHPLAVAFDFEDAFAISFLSSSMEISTMLCSGRNSKESCRASDVDPGRDGTLMGFAMHDVHAEE